MQHWHNEEENTTKNHRFPSAHAYLYYSSIIHILFQKMISKEKADEKTY